MPCHFNREFNPRSYRHRNQLCRDAVERRDYNTLMNQQQDARRHAPISSAPQTTLDTLRTSVTPAAGGKLERQLQLILPMPLE